MNSEIILSEIKARLERMRPDFEALSLHGDTLEEGEHIDHAWNLSCEAYALAEWLKAVTMPLSK